MEKKKTGFWCRIKNNLAIVGLVLSVIAAGGCIWGAVRTGAANAFFVLFEAAVLCVLLFGAYAYYKRARKKEFEMWTKDVCAFNFFKEFETYRLIGSVKKSKDNPYVYDACANYSEWERAISTRYNWAINSDGQESTERGKKNFYHYLRGLLRNCRESCKMHVVLMIPCVIPAVTGALTFTDTDDLFMSQVGCFLVTISCIFTCVFLWARDKQKTDFLLDFIEVVFPEEFKNDYLRSEP